MLLIGSRALAHNIPEYKPYSCVPYYFVATQAEAFAWLAEQSKLHYVATVRTKHKKYSYLTGRGTVEDIATWTYYSKEDGKKIYDELKRADNRGLLGTTKLCGAFGLGGIRFEIELAIHPSNSATKILEAAKDAKVASLEILEAIYTSDLIVSDNFCKHMEELHIIRDKLKELKEQKDESGKEQKELKGQKDESESGKELKGQKDEKVLPPTRAPELQNLIIRRRMEHRMTTYMMWRTYKKPSVDRETFEKSSMEFKLNFIRECVVIEQRSRSLWPLTVFERTRVEFNHSIFHACTRLQEDWLREFAVDVYPKILDPAPEILDRLYETVLKSLR